EFVRYVPILDEALYLLPKPTDTAPRCRSGEMIFSSDASYRGSFAGNKFHGEGRYEWNDGATYEGGWRENKMHGKGCYSDSEKSRWEGDFFNGMYDNG
ncbi:unnamed protein product, partial [Ectocarpus sp. 8 AP-2014]